MPKLEILGSGIYQHSRGSSSCPWPLVAGTCAVRRHGTCCRVHTPNEIITFTFCSTGHFHVHPLPHRWPGGARGSESSPDAHCGVLPVPSIWGSRSLLSFCMHAETQRALTLMAACVRALPRKSKTAPPAPVVPVCGAGRLAEVARTPLSSRALSAIGGR